MAAMISIAANPSVEAIAMMMMLANRNNTAHISNVCSFSDLKKPETN